MLKYICMAQHNRILSHVIYMHIYSMYICMGGEGGCTHIYTSQLQISHHGSQQVGC